MNKLDELKHNLTEEKLQNEKVRRPTFPLPYVKDRTRVFLPSLPTSSLGFLIEGYNMDMLKS